MEIDYLKLLTLFTEKFNTSKPELMAPFKEGDFCYSTNGAVICQIPNNLITDLPANEHELGCLQLFNPPVQKTPLKITAITDLLEKCPHTPVMIDNSLDCETCNCGGEVDYVFSFNSIDYKRTLPCPVCDGLGLIVNRFPDPSGKTEPDCINGVIKIGDVYFALTKLQLIIEAAELLKSDTITIVNNDKLLHITINDVSIIVMPLNIDFDANNVATQSYHLLGEINYTPVLITEN